MAVGMGVRLARGLAARVRMPVVLVVHVRVVVVELDVGVRVLVALGEVEPDARCHQETRRHEPPRQLLREDQHREDGAEERRQREVGAGPRGSDLPERAHEEHEAHAIADEPERGCGDDARGGGEGGPPR